MITQTLGERAIALLANIIIFYIAFHYATDRWLLTESLESVWLLSAFALWFFGLLSSPYFVPPRDALANAITASCILIIADLAQAKEFRNELDIIRWLAVAYCGLVAFFSLTALFLHDRNQRSRWGRISFRYQRDFRERRTSLHPASHNQHHRRIPIKFFHGGLASYPVELFYCGTASRAGACFFVGNGLPISSCAKKFSGGRNNRARIRRSKSRVPPSGSFKQRFYYRNCPLN